MITVLGSINIDLVAKTSRLPRPGETVAGISVTTEAGGKGANQALAVYRAGQPVRLVGAVGRDAFADSALAILNNTAIDLKGVRRADEVTGTAFILVGNDGENMITVVPGANSTLNDEDIEACFAGLQAGDLLMLQQEIPMAVIEKALVKARGRGIMTMLNTAPASKDVRQIAPLADIIVANETEFELLIGKKLQSIDATTTALRELYAETKQTIIITLGASGVVAVTNGAVLRSAALEIQPIDTVGAGDTFCGYLAAGIISGEDIELSLRKAAIAGSVACLRPGAQSAIPERDAIHQHL